MFLGWWVPHVVKHLPSKCEALSSNTSTTKKKKKKPKVQKMFYIPGHKGNANQNNIKSLPHSSQNVNHQ
jgi:hypothetical protein